MSSAAVSLARGNSIGAQEQHRSKAFGVAGFASAWMAIVWIILDTPGTLYETSLLLAILTTLLLPLAIQYVRDDLDLFESIIFANISLASMFLGRPIYDLGTNTFIQFWFGSWFDAKPGFDDMLFYAWLGCLALQLGYFSPFARGLAKKLPAFRQGVDPDRTIKVSLFMFVVGAVLFEEYVRQSGGLSFLLGFLNHRGAVSLKMASGYLFIGPLFWPPAGMVALAAWFKSRKPAHLYLALGCLACFFISMLGGIGRTFEVQGILGVTVIYYVGRGKRPSMLLVIPAVFLGLGYLVYGRSARSVSTFEDKQLIVERIIDHPVESIQTIWSQDDAAMSDYFSVMVANIPSRIDYGNGSVISDILLRAYPRFLWPGGVKPDEHIVLIFKLFFPRIFYRYSTGAACSVIGEFYIDHGGFTVFLGMLTVGFILAVPKQWMQITGSSLPAQILFVSMPAYSVSLMRGGIPAFVEYIAITLIPVFLIAKYAQKTGAAS